MDKIKEKFSMKDTGHDVVARRVLNTAPNTRGMSSVWLPKAASAQVTPMREPFKQRGFWY
jgi:hypothetical protein